MSPSEFETVPFAEGLLQGSKKHPDRDCIVVGDDRVTYRELEARGWKQDARGWSPEWYSRLGSNGERAQRTMRSAESALQITRLAPPLTIPVPRTRREPRG